MMMTPHMLVGASLGAAIRRPWLALPLAFLSHFVLDRLPHVDPDALPGIHGEGPAAAVAVGETVLGVALVAWAVRGKPWARIAAACAFAAVLIDLLDNVPPWNAWFKAWPGTRWLSAFHTAMQGDVPPAQWAFGLAVQILVVVLALWYLSRRASAVPSARPVHPMEVAR